MGTDKSTLRLGGRTFTRIISEIASPVGAVTVIERDVVPHRGPLTGFYTGLLGAKAKAVIFLSCDMPFVSESFIRELAAEWRKTSRAVFARESGRAGFPCILPADAADLVRDELEKGAGSLQSLARRLRARMMAASNPEELRNVNTPDDYRSAEALFARNQAILDVDRLAIRRGRVNLLADFSWRVAPGQHWVILGANGSGKTSLLSALLGYLTPTAGDVRVLGELYGDSDWRALRGKIGLVSSSIRQMMPEAEPAWITVASGRYAMIDFWGTPNAADKRAALRILEQTECSYLADRDWSYLSQGERQRVLIGRALMADPALLILDEPCAGLDPAAREHFLQFLERLGRQADAPALVLVTHHVEEIMPVFTHALLLKAGRKLAEGPVSTVLNARNLTEAFSTPIRLRKRENRYSLSVQSNDRVIL